MNDMAKDPHRPARALDPDHMKRYYGRSDVNIHNQSHHEFKYVAKNHESNLWANHLKDQTELDSPPRDAISAIIFGPGSSTKLLVSSWDKNVYLYDTHAEPGGDGSGRLIRSFEHRAPVLDVCFGKDDTEAFSVGLDWDVRR